MAANKDWMLSEVEELISVWEGCRCLCDVTSKDYKDKQKKKDAMQEIARQSQFIQEAVVGPMPLSHIYPRPCPHSSLLVSSLLPSFNQDT